MRDTVHYILEAGRLRFDDTVMLSFNSKPGDMQGAFKIQIPDSAELRIISSIGESWEHVSVSTATRCPIWAEMCIVKRLFWRDDECVVQYHPPEKDYVDHHPYCLHLWKPIGVVLPQPPSHLVGPKT